MDSRQPPRLTATVGRTKLRRMASKRRETDLTASFRAILIASEDRRKEKEPYSDSLAYMESQAGLMIELWKATLKDGMVSVTFRFQRRQIDGDVWLPCGAWKFSFQDRPNQQPAERDRQLCSAVLDELHQGLLRLSNLAGRLSYHPK